MTIERLAAVGATLIALLALIASQFPPLHTYFQAAAIQVYDPARVSLACSAQGVRVVVMLPLQNTGNAHADVAQINLEVTDSAGSFRQRFTPAYVPSEPVMPLSFQISLEPFSGRNLAPSERWIGMTHFAPLPSDPSDQSRLRNVLMIVQRQIHDQYSDYPGYSGGIALSDEVALAFEEVLAQQNAWLSRPGLILGITVTWVDSRGATHIESLERRLELSEAVLAEIADAFAAHRLAENPDFFSGCDIPIELS